MQTSSPQHDRRIKKILARAERKRLSRGIERTFGHITGDEHLIHSSRRHAKTAGFKRRPVRGAHIAAIALEASQAIYRELHGHTPISVYHHVKFHRPVYQTQLQRTVTWARGESPEPDIIPLLEIEKKKVRVESTLYPVERVPFSRQESLTPEIHVPFSITSAALHQYRRKIQGRKNGISETIPHGLVQAYFPGALVRILEKAYEEVSIVPLPVNSEMHTWFHQGLTSRNPHMRVRFVAEEKKAREYVYTFEGDIYQDERIVANAQLIARSQREIQKELIARVTSLERITL